MKKLIETYPEDLDAITMYAESILDLDPWKWWTNKGKPREGTMEAIDRLEFVWTETLSILAQTITQFMPGKSRLTPLEL